MSDDRLETDTCQVGTESPRQELWDGDEGDISASLESAALATCPFVRSVNNTYWHYVPGDVVGSGGTGMKQDKAPAPRSL